MSVCVGVSVCVCVCLSSIRHGPKWEAFRQEVQHILLQPQTAKKYIPPLNDIASEFMVR